MTSSGALLVCTAGCSCTASGTPRRTAPAALLRPAGCCATLEIRQPCDAAHAMWTVAPGRRAGCKRCWVPRSSQPTSWSVRVASPLQTSNVAGARHPHFISAPPLVPSTGPVTSFATERPSLARLVGDCGGTLAVAKVSAGRWLTRCETPPVLYSVIALAVRVILRVLRGRCGVDCACDVDRNPPRHSLTVCVGAGAGRGAWSHRQ